ncbi:MAG: 5-formyltetrahydrofolate cyclo-ligase [Alphaproteobacteria bacterium]|nr:5-formyltetrahydrofolate cyclo-ligase [Alphaproteobacteria bacterium]
MNPSSLADEKADLRKRCYAGRMAIDADEAEAAAKAVGERVGALVDVDDRVVVSAYWPLEGELDPRPALLALLARGATAALPRVVGDGRPLDFHAWQPDDRLVEGRFRVMEPTPDAARVSPSVLLVPLLAFDRQCRRLGHGKGYYDRTLQDLKVNDPAVLPEPAVLAVGVAFAAQEVGRVPTDEFDQTLDMVITEQTVHRPA